MQVLGARASGRNEERASSAEGNGASAGIVLSMDMVSTNYYAVAYTVPVQVGASQQNFSLQVDTGSSDLWIASKSCSSASCSSTSGRLYDPGSSQSTGATFTMQYLSGFVEGPIVWDQMQIGGYVIPNQALTAATTVNNEPLAYNFDGILGLALPLNSVIQQTIPASLGNAPDGAAISSNLFSLTPVASAPSQPFFSLTLSRPGSSQIPSLLGIGRHPSQIVPDPTQIRYSSLVSDSIGTLYWKTTIRAITVYVNGQAHPVTLQSLSGTTEPTALLDSGIPLIITTPPLANGIYGALGIGPASDGNYYVPCATPINMTITLDGQNELPLHPLDLTAEPAGQSSSQFCLGLIQTDPSQLTASSDRGDMILGVPFMRSVYTVMAYEQPNATGGFNYSVQLGTNPALGLLGLTNATQALEEFKQMRVPESSQETLNPQSEGPRLSIGVKIFIGLVGFFALCLALFALRYLVARRRWRGRSSPGQLEGGPNPRTEYGAYQAARNKSRESIDQSVPLYTSTPRKDVCTTYSGRTCVEEEDYVSEFGVRKSKFESPGGAAALDICDPWDPYAGTWRDTIVGTDAGEADSVRSSYPPPRKLAEVEPDSPSHASLDLTSALLTEHERSDSQTSDDPGPEAEFGVDSVGMAGIGTVARGSVIDAGKFRSSVDSVGSSARFRQTVSSLRSSHTFVSPRESTGASVCDDSDRTFSKV